MDPFRSVVTQERILEYLAAVNGPETIREIATAIDIEASAVAGNLGALMSQAERGAAGVRRVMGDDTTRYEIAPAKN